MQSVSLVCFPHAGAGRMYYTKWRSLFGDEVDLQIVQYPLREHRMRDPMPDTVGELADEIFDTYADAFRGTYAIWGHSMGSTIGYEVARRCQNRLDNPPLVFFSSGASAPCESRFKRVADLDSPEGLRDVLLRYGGLTSENLEDPDFVKFFSPVIEADLRLLGGYQETTFEKLRCPAAVMVGRDDTANVEDWPRYIDGPVSITEFDGGHFFLDEHRVAMSSRMTARLQLEWQLRGMGPTGDADTPEVLAQMAARLAQ